jgi:hypothetical protein
MAPDTLPRAYTRKHALAFRTALRSAKISLFTFFSFRAKTRPRQIVMEAIMSPVPCYFVGVSAQRLTTCVPRYMNADGQFSA